jgi:DNA gyrase subunit A
VILPVKLPNLLVNGSAGIAVGMATNIPPHNLGEVADALCLLIDNPEATVDELAKVVKGPDFPTGGYILGRDGIRDAFRTGRGSIQLQAKASIETDKKDREKIVVHELPYQVNKAQLIEAMAELVRDKKVEGVKDLRDESDREGMRIVIELQKDANAQVLLNQLYKHTNLRTSFSIIMLALVDGQPRILNLKGLLHFFILHRKEVIVRRAKFELAKAERRAHILEGYKVALDNLDAVIKLIRASKNTEEAREGLMRRFKLSEIQAVAILELRLQSLTNLERKKIDDEYLEVIKTIERLKGLLASDKKILALIKEETLAVKEQYGDPRRTEIIAKAQDLTVEDLIAEEQMVVTLSHGGYIKRLPVGTYRSQKRGGKGVAAMGTKEEDFVEALFVASTHDVLLVFTNIGKVHWLKVFEIPETSRAAKGKHISNLLQMAKDEQVASVIAVRDFQQEAFLVMGTRKGLVKKTKLEAYGNPRNGGIIAITLTEGDTLIDVQLGTDKEDLVLATFEGMAIRSSLEEVREVGRVGQGVKGVTLEKKDYVVGMEVVRDPKGTLLTVTQHGFGKRTDLEEYRQQGRGGKGLINMKVTDKTGNVVAVRSVRDDDELMVISTNGTMLRMKIADIKTIGRNTQGVRLIRLQDQEQVGAVARVVASKDDEEGGEEA